MKSTTQPPITQSIHCIDIYSGTDFFRFPNDKFTRLLGAGSLTNDHFFGRRLSRPCFILLPYLVNMYSFYLGNARLVCINVFVHETSSITDLGSEFEL